MNNLNTPQREADVRWLHRGIGLVLGITFVLAIKTLGAIPGAAFCIAFMLALLIFSKVF